MCSQTRFLCPLLFAAFFGLGAGLLEAATRYQVDPAFKSPTLTALVTGQIYAQPLADSGALVAGDFSVAGGQPVGPLVRLDADGTVETPNWLAAATAAGVTIGSSTKTWQLADGRVLVAAPATGIGPVAFPVAGAAATVLRLNGSGFPDPRYKLILGVGAYDAASVSGFWPLADGRILITGHFTSAGGHVTRDAAALAADGSIDPTYTSLTDFSGPVAVGTDGALYGVLQPPSGIIAQPMTLGRLAASGAQTDSWLLPYGSGQVSAMGITADGNALVSATASVAGIVSVGGVALPLPPVPIATALVYRLQRGNSAPVPFFGTATQATTVTEIHVLANGGVLLVGQLPQVSSVQPAGLLRLNADGSPDLLFSAPSLAGESVAGLQLLSDGWMAVLASTTGTPTFKILRKLDINFGLRTDFSADLRQAASAGAAWALPDNSVLLQGNFANPSGTVQRFARLRADGALDFAHVPLAPETAAASIAAVDAAGHVYLTGASLGPVFTAVYETTAEAESLGTSAPITTAVSSVTDMLVSAAVASVPALTAAQVERFSMDGVPDQIFGRASLPDPADQVKSVQVDSQNRVLIVGALGTGLARIVRLTPTGALDPTFNFYPPPVSNADRATTMSVNPSGVGYVLVDTLGDVYPVADNGTFPSPIPLYTAAGLAQLTPAAGALLASGDFSSLLGNSSAALVRLLPSALPDPSWRSELSAGSSLNTVQPLPDGRFIVTGIFQELPGQQFQGTAILTASGAIDANENLPSGVSTLPNAGFFCVAADGSLYAFEANGAIQHWVAIPRPDLALIPAAPSFTVGDPLRLDVSGGGGSAGTVVWSHNGVVVSGASGTELLLPIAGAADAGWYTAQVTTSAGTVSATAYVGVAPINAWIANASARSFLGSGDAAQTIGFVVVNGAASEPALVRFVNDGLAQFGMPDYTTSTSWSLSIGGVPWIPSPFFIGFPSYSGAMTVPNAALVAGAFPIGNSAADFQNLIAPRPGVPYTYLRTAPPAQAGVTLTELYLPDTSDSLASGRRLVNFSCRAQVGQGDQQLVAGFVVEGNESLQILIRGLGPALSRFGVADAVDQPVLTVYSGPGIVARNVGWQNQTQAAQVAAATTKAGAFALAPGADCALLLTLPPGAYTAVLQTGDQVGNVGMIELYDASD